MNRKKVDRKILLIDIADGIEMHQSRWDEFELLFPKFYHEEWRLSELNGEVDYDYEGENENPRLRKIDMSSFYDVKMKRKKFLERLLNDEPDITTRIEDFVKRK